MAWTRNSLINVVYLFGHKQEKLNSIKSLVIQIHPTVLCFNTPDEPDHTADRAETSFPPEGGEGRWPKKTAGPSDKDSRRRSQSAGVNRASKCSHVHAGRS